MREITKLRQSHPDFEPPDTNKITHASLVSQLDTPSGISQIGTNPVSTLATKAKAPIENVDINKYARPEINTETEDSVALANISSQSPNYCTDPEKYCQN